MTQKDWIEGDGSRNFSWSKFWFESSRITQRASLVFQLVKNLLAMQGVWVRPLGQEDPLEKEMAIHSSILAWRIPWTAEPGGLQSMGLRELDTTYNEKEWFTPRNEFTWIKRNYLEWSAVQFIKKITALLISRHKTALGETLGFSRGKSQICLHKRLQCVC